jgi:hypothetical protein
LENDIVIEVYSDWIKSTSDRRFCRSRKLHQSIGRESGFVDIPSGLFGEDNRQNNANALLKQI